MSTVTATSGRDESARTLGAVVAVQMTICSPVQWKPIGITCGRPSRPLYASRAELRGLQQFARAGLRELSVEFLAIHLVSLPAVGPRLSRPFTW